jgi:hypothetical protein
MKEPIIIDIDSYKGKVRYRATWKGDFYYAYPDSKSKYFRKSCVLKEGRKYKQVILYLHRSIYEYYKNIKLTPKDVIHHKNGNIYDNSIENLELSNSIEHPKKHYREHLKEFICGNCGNAFKTSSSSVVNHGTKRRYCSRFCQMKSYMKKYKEEHKLELKKYNKKYCKAYYRKNKEKWKQKYI